MLSFLQYISIYFNINIATFVGYILLAAILELTPEIRTQDTE